MKDILIHPAAPKAPHEDERQSLVQRIVASPQFVKAAQLRDILLYLSRRAMEDNPTSISEYEVACDALGRRADINTNEDNIVRVQVRHLRRKLEEYFSSDGAAEKLLLTIPKGSYVPRFEPRPANPVKPPETEVPSPAPEITPVANVAPAAAKEAPPAKQNNHLPTIALAIVLAITGTGTVYLWRDNAALRRAVPPAAADAAARDPLWSRLFTPGQRLSVVVADSCYVAMQDILDLDIPLREYLSGGYPAQLISSVPDPKLRAALKLISSRQYTSLGDLTIATKVLELSHRYNGEAVLRYARHLDTRELKTGNYIMIGSRRGIPWIQLFEPQLNFLFEEDQATRKYHFRNRSPRPGEQAAYGSTEDVSYADVAVVPNLSGSGYVLILCGITMEATEAAGEFVTTPDFTAAMAGMLKKKAGQPYSPYMEVLVQVSTMPGTARASRLVSYRILNPKAVK